VKGLEKNVRYDHLDRGPYTVTSANDRRATNPLAIGKFLKINKVPEALKINKQHSYRSDITFRLGIIMDIDTEYTEEEMLEFMKAELPVQDIKRLIKKITDEEGHTA
jgi:hypothetical protein